MKYFYFILCGLVILAALYSATGVAFFKWNQYKVEHPKANFQIINNGSNEITIVDFTNYRCGYCKGMQDTIKEALSLQKNIRYVPRPVLLGINPEAEKIQEPAELAKLAMAAGMQGKFEAMHTMFMEYPDAIIPEDLIKETAELYGIDYAKMVEDSQSETVKKYLDNNIKDMVGFGIETIPSYIINKDIYIMFSNLKKQLKIGEAFPLALTFENAGEITRTVEVVAPGTSPHAHH